jgi:hypothetical protein
MTRAPITLPPVGYPRLSAVSLRCSPSIGPRRAVVFVFDKTGHRTVLGEPE